VNIKKFTSMFIALLLIASMIASCAPAPVAEAPVIEDAPASEVAPAVEEDTPVTGEQAPASEEYVPFTVNGVYSEGKWPQQYTLQEYMAFSGVELEFKSREEFDPRVAEYMGVEIPDDVNERLPKDVMVVAPYDNIGTYGGQMEALSLGPESGNSEFLSWRHVNLVRFLDDLETIVPEVAKDYSFNEDMTEFTFVLREGHKWSDGEPFTVDDVLFWYNDIMLNKELYPETPAFLMYGGEPLTFEKVDDVTLKVTAAASAPGFLSYLAATYVQFFAPKHILMEKHLDYNQDVAQIAVDEGYTNWVEYFFGWFGNWQDSVHRYGIPKLESWILVEETTEHKMFAANPYYFKVDTTGQQLPYIDYINQTYATDEEVIELKVISGEIDEKSQTLDFTSAPMYIEHATEGGYSVELTPSGSQGPKIGFNCTHKDPEIRSFFDNKDFRLAMSMAINREELNEVSCMGQCEPVNAAAAPFHYMSSYSKPEWYQVGLYDVDGANEILDSIGLDQRDSEGWRLLPSGKRFIIFMEYTLQYFDTETMELVKEYWEEVGIKTEIKEVSSEAFRARATANEHDVATMINENVLETATLANQERFVPPFGPRALEEVCGASWADWMATNGAEGEEPSDVIKELYALTDQFKTSIPGTDEYVEVAQKIGDIHADNLWVIGLLTASPSVTIFNDRIQNNPPIKITVFDFYRMYPYRPDQWYIQE